MSQPAPSSNSLIYLLQSPFLSNMTVLWPSSDHNYQIYPIINEMLKEAVSIHNYMAICTQIFQRFISVHPTIYTFTMCKCSTIMYICTQNCFDNKQTHCMLLSTGESIEYPTTTSSNLESYSIFSSIESAQVF